MLEYRKSRESDIQELTELVMKCFGNRERHGVFKNLNNRYTVCIDTYTNKIVGMSGLDSNDDYIGGPELGYSCVDPEYRKLGIMTNLIGQIIEEAKAKNCKRIYCSGWHLPNKEYANLHSILTKYEFSLVVPSRCTWRQNYNCNLTSNPENKAYCVNSSNVCSCKEDLYMKEL